MPEDNFVIDRQSTYENPIHHVSSVSPNNKVIIEKKIYNIT